MQITDKILQKYAEVIVNTGIHLQPGQSAQIFATIEVSDFACRVMEECYKAGAKKVDIEWSCDAQNRLNYQYASEETLSEVHAWEEAKLQYAVDELPCRIYLLSEDPDAMAGIDVNKLSNVMRNRGKITKPYRNAIDGKFQWVCAGVPCVPWAKKCFPNDSDEVAVQKLWDAVLETVRITEDNDPVALWKEHTEFINAKCAWMNAQHFVKLHYSSKNGTDFTVDLIPEARWEGAGMTNKRNDTFYIPNLPTEEVFTTPRAGSCEGTLVSTKPLSWNSQLIENFSITFENGHATRVKAEVGEAMLEQMIHMDEYSSMLGEVALVPKESPINRCGFLFYNTLYDENAACHCALGMGFREVLPDGDELTVEEARARGINDSVIHVDFMVGSDDLEVIGIRADGTETPVFVNGTWAE